MYLKELKSNCRNQAETIKGWKALTRSQLCENYLKYEKTDKNLANAYMSALLYSYWNVITYDYLHQGAKKLLTQEDCYNLIVDAILYVLDKKAWLNPKSSLYGDEKGPEKAINKVLDSRKINFFVATTRSKRKINYNNLSLDELEDESSDGYYVRSEVAFKEPNINLDKFVIDSYNRKEYLQAFMVDAIMNNNFQNTTIEDGKVFSQFNYQSLNSYLRTLDNKKCLAFSERYKINYDDVLKSSQYIVNNSRQSMEKKVSSTLKVLARDEKFLNNIR